MLTNLQFLTSQVYTHLVLCNGARLYCDPAYHVNRSRKSRLMNYKETFERIATTSYAQQDALLMPGFIQVFSGNIMAAVAQLPILGRGVISRPEVKVNGLLSGFDFKTLYDIYNIIPTASPDFWFDNYISKPANDQLQTIFENINALPLEYSIDVKLQVQGPISFGEIYLGFRTIQLRMSGLTKNFIVTNSASIGVFNKDGFTLSGMVSDVHGTALAH